MGGVADRSTDDVWAPVAQRFVDHHGSLRGRVRTHVIGEHLGGHMAPPPQRVVDVGGGAGHQSVPLARAGHEVTIVDPAPAMLERAARRLADEPADVAARVRLVEAAGQDAPRVLGGGPSTPCCATACSCTSTTLCRSSTPCAS